MHFGEKLRQLRQARELTQPDLADSLGIEQSWLSKLENDKCTPSSELLDKIGQVFELSLDQLLADVDPNYLRKNLATLPEVRGLLQQKKYRLVHNARTWLMAATVCATLGVTLFVAGKNHLLFSDQLYVYESQGVIYESEPEMLFEKKEFILDSLINSTTNIDPESDMSVRLWEEQKNQTFRKKLLEVEHRINTAQENTFQYRGPTYRKEEILLKEANDIYGNTTNAGSPAYRIYYLAGDLVKPRLENRLLILLGIMLTAAGLLLYFVEWRITRLTKGLN